MKAFGIDVPASDFPALRTSRDSPRSNDDSGPVLFVFDVSGPRSEEKVTHDDTHEFICILALGSTFPLSIFPALRSSRDGLVVCFNLKATFKESGC